MQYFGPEIGEGGVFALTFTEFVVVNVQGCSVHMLHTNLNAKTVELSAKRIVQGRWRFIHGKKNTF